MNICVELKDNDYRDLCALAASLESNPPPEVLARLAIIDYVHSIPPAPAPAPDPVSFCEYPAGEAVVPPVELSPELREALTSFCATMKRLGV